MRPLRAASLLAFAAPIAAAACLTACGTEENVRPTIAILAPEDGASLESRTVPVTVQIERFALSETTLDPQNPEGEPFHGHWHLYLDYNFVTHVYSTSFTISNVEPGSHSVIAELVNQNHFPVFGTPYAEVFVDVPATANGVTITSPAGGQHRSTSVDLAIDVQSFTLDSAAIGGPNAPDTGHYHVYLGSIDAANLLEEGTRTDVTIGGLPRTVGISSDVELLVVLAANDHTVVSPLAQDSLSLVIPGDAPGLRILAPEDGAVVTSAFDLAWATENVATTGTAGSVVHVFVDDVQIATAQGTTQQAISLSPGAHDLRIELRSSAGAPFDPPVVDVHDVSAE